MCCAAVGRGGSYIRVSDATHQVEAPLVAFGYTTTARLTISTFLQVRATNQGIPDNDKEDLLENNGSDLS